MLSYSYVKKNNEQTNDQDKVKYLKNYILTNQFSFFKALVHSKNDLYPSLIKDILSSKGCDQIKFLTYCFYDLHFRFETTDIFYDCLDTIEDNNLFIFLLEYLYTVQPTLLNLSLKDIFDSYFDSYHKNEDSIYKKIVHFLISKKSIHYDFINKKQELNVKNISNSFELINSIECLDFLLMNLILYSWTFEYDYKLIMFHDFAIPNYLNKGKFDFVEICLLKKCSYNKIFVYKSLTKMEPSITNKIVEKCKTSIIWSKFISQFEPECKKNNYQIHCINTIKELTKELLLNTIKGLASNNFISNDCIDITKYCISNYI